MRKLGPDARIERHPVRGGCGHRRTPQRMPYAIYPASPGNGYSVASAFWEDPRMPTVIEEKDAIREAMAEYCFRLDGARYDDMAALFSEDGTWDTAFGKATGRAEIAGLARDIRVRAGDSRPRAMHLVTNIVITLDGESAEARSNWTVVQ